MRTYERLVRLRLNLGGRRLCLIGYISQIQCIQRRRRRARRRWRRGGGGRGSRLGGVAHGRLKYGCVRRFGKFSRGTIPDSRAGPFEASSPRRQ